MQDLLDDNVVLCEVEDGDENEDEEVAVSEAPVGDVIVLQEISEDDENDGEESEEEGDEDEDEDEPEEDDGSEEPEQEQATHTFVPIILAVRNTEDPNDFSHAELVEKQLAEIFGEDNKRYAQYAMGREPSLGEMFLHYCRNGGPEDFEKRHGRKTGIGRFE